jgi:imidazolonepropionase-like amidohydrolase
MVVSPIVAQHIGFDFDRDGRDGDRGYPNSLMGSIALIRQSFIDASWYQSAQDAYRKNPATTERPETNASLAALAEQMQRNPAVFEAEDELDLLRALRIAEEFKLKPILFGNGYEYRVRKTLAEKKPGIILPLDFPKPPEIERPENALEVELDELQHWDRAPSNPARLAEAGIPFALTTQKLEKPEKDFWSRLRLAVRRGLSKDAALAALTTTPAEMFEPDDRSPAAGAEIGEGSTEGDGDVAVVLGPATSLPPRRDDDYDSAWNSAAKLQQAGVRFCIASNGRGAETNERNVGYEAGLAAGYGLPKEEALKAVTIYAAQILGVADGLGSLEAGKAATLIVTNGDPLDFPTQVEAAFVDGRKIDLSNRQTPLRHKYRENIAAIIEKLSAATRQSRLTPSGGRCRSRPVYRPRVSPSPAFALRGAAR